jgi:hypothetical protein
VSTGDIRGTERRTPAILPDGGAREERSRGRNAKRKPEPSRTPRLPSSPLDPPPAEDRSSDSETRGIDVLVGGRARDSLGLASLLLLHS